MWTERPEMLTSEEAELGIGRRVRNTETSQVGVLEGVKHRSEKNYWVGVVECHGERDWVWLKKLEWVDGPPPTPTTRPRPYHDVLNALARYRESGKPETLFKLLFGRPPSREEVKFIKGKLGGTCEKCGLDLYPSLEPDGSCQLSCGCPAPPAGYARPSIDPSLN